MMPSSRSFHPLQISDEEELTLIDFPQMVSVAHPNAEELFERDVEGVVKFFERKIGYLPEGDPALQLVRPTFQVTLIIPCEIATALVCTLLFYFRCSNFVEYY